MIIQKLVAQLDFLSPHPSSWGEEQTCSFFIYGIGGAKIGRLKDFQLEDHENRLGFLF